MSKIVTRISKTGGRKDVKSYSLEILLHLRVLCSKNVPKILWMRSMIYYLMWRKYNNIIDGRSENEVDYKQKEPTVKVTLKGLGIAKTIAPGAPHAAQFFLLIVPKRCFVRFVAFNFFERGQKNQFSFLPCSVPLRSYTL